MRVEVTQCDGCKKILTKTQDIYHLIIKTDNFWNVVEDDYLIERLDFCYSCAKDIKETLKRILHFLEAEVDDGK